MDSVELGLPYRVTPFAAAIYAIHQLARVWTGEEMRLAKGAGARSVRHRSTGGALLHQTSLSDESDDLITYLDTTLGNLHEFLESYVRVHRPGG